ncbi:hypothetical protein [Mangrovivirga cuniculi]|uniref:TonB-dependent receptor-like beta-barrel domain-containing protein n=1 Tax=Mangrovivirga cuniculi TaxID=2715131 RepID=A0A4D7JHT8_9BACT|nr:hypothetical protein [Mangrovivirga cuniculi]QCK15191.1 hypothetical protein DCC35_10750 [Mangrovivirga cuniculi]
MGGITYRKNQWRANLRYRYLGDRPGDETNTLIAEGYFLLDSNIKYEREKFFATLTLENILDEEWAEAQFATESRLRGEAQSVTEMNFTPGYPLTFRVQVGVRF